MNPKAVLALGALALIVLTMALLIGRQYGDVGEPADEALLPGLREQVNDIEAIDIFGPDGERVVALRRERERWRVREKSGFEADFVLIHDLLRDLSEARRHDERTSNPDWYARLGVADPGTEGSDGVLVRFPETGLPGVIIGQADSAGIGRFARIVDESPSWLIDRSPEVPATVLGWLERAVMDIPASALAEITIRHPDGDTVRLRPAGEDSDQWVLLGVPEGREAAPTWQIQPLAGALSGLELEDVRVHDRVPADAVRTLYRTRDGLNFVASLFRDDEGHWLHFSVSAEMPASETDEMDEESAQLAIDAAAVDGRLSPWQFAITNNRYDRMTRRLEDLLADPEA